MVDFVGENERYLELRNTRHSSEKGNYWGRKENLWHISLSMGNVKAYLFPNFSVGTNPLVRTAFSGFLNTVNPLLSPSEGLFFQALLRGGLTERGGVKERGGGLI